MHYDKKQEINVPKYNMRYIIKVEEEGFEWVKNKK